jgi:hypothetical protein
MDCRCNNDVKTQSITGSQRHSGRRAAQWEFSVEMLPATRDTIYRTILSTLMAEKRVENRLAAWVRSGDTTYATDATKSAQGCARIWLLELEAPDVSLEPLAVSIFLNNEEPGWRVSTVAEAVAVSDLVAASLNFARANAQR